ncbi:MAG: hypothetical protein QM768_20230 [Agriterribacter sp.]
MGNQTRDLRKSRNDKEATRTFNCVDLVESNRFIHYHRDPFGMPGSECGTEAFRIKKSLVTFSRTGTQCPNGKDIWLVSAI